MEIQKSKEGIFFLVKVIPGSRKNQIVGIEETHVKIRIKGAPEKGKANKELIKFLAKIFDIGSSRVEIRSGETSKTKRIFLSGISEEVFWKTLSGCSEA
jgi:hypothetical protein